MYFESQTCKCSCLFLDNVEIMSALTNIEVFGRKLINLVRDCGPGTSNEALDLQFLQ